MVACTMCMNHFVRGRFITMLGLCVFVMLGLGGLLGYDLSLLFGLCMLGLTL